MWDSKVTQFYTYRHSLFYTLCHYGYHRLLNIAPCAIQ